MNTFITNYTNNIGANNNTNTPIENGTLIFNISNNAHDALNDYGNISDQYKKKTSDYLKLIRLPNLLIAQIFCKHYQIELYKELIYYVNYFGNTKDSKGNIYVPEFNDANLKDLNFTNAAERSKNINDLDLKDQIASQNTTPLFTSKAKKPKSTSYYSSESDRNAMLNYLDKVDKIKSKLPTYPLTTKAPVPTTTKAPIPTTTPKTISSTPIGVILQFIDYLVDSYSRYNQKLIRDASLSLNTSDPLDYDSTREKHLPAKLINVYDYVKTKLATIPVDIANSSNLLDVINKLFDNGINTRIAKDAIGIAEGGILLNEIQETILVLCKIIMPPTEPTFSIKDECLGTFTLDKSRESAINLFTENLDEYNKINSLFIDNTNNKYDSLLDSVKNFNNLLLLEIGIICGHIDNYYTKLLSLDLEEFTNTRIEQIALLYSLITNELEDLINSLE